MTVIKFGELANGLEGAIQQWLELSQAQEKARGAMTALLVRRLITQDARLARLEERLVALEHREMRPTTLFGRFIWWALGVEYADTTDFAGNGGEQGSDGDDHCECGQHVDPGGSLGVCVDQ